MVVVGAGVVGLAVARALALAGREVLVLEREAQIGSGTSARNSEVIHAGIYYPAGSLKARHCVRGRQWLYQYLKDRGIAHRQIGKLIVANTPQQLAGLPDIVRRAQANGVHDLTLIGRDEARNLEPALECLGAVLSPSTGILDSHGLMLALQGDLEHAGGTVACHSEVRRVSAHHQGLDIVMADGLVLRARGLVNAAGLHACALAAATAGLPARYVPNPRYAKGNYFILNGRVPFSRLIYPAPDPLVSLAGLGIHLTLDLGGQARFGPDVQWVDRVDDYSVDPARSGQFEDAVRLYWPDLPEGSLQPGYAGIRPKITGPGEPTADFCLQGPNDHGVPGLINLFAIESPGLTSCLSIADEVSHLLA